MYWFFPRKMLPCISALDLARLITWFVVWALQYYTLWATNNLYAMTLNGQSVRVRR